VTNLRAVNELKSRERPVLIFDAGGKAQKSIKATVIRRDHESDLALLRVDGGGKWPVLEIGTDADVAELDAAVWFGSPYDRTVSEGKYPAPVAGNGKVVAVVRGESQSLAGVQLDGAFGPLDAGGPVVSLSGKVAGVASRWENGANNDLAVPPGRLRKFLAAPEIAFTPPPVRPDDRGKPAAFGAIVTAILPLETPYEVELVLDSGDGERTYTMKRDGLRYIAEAPAFRPGAPRPRMELVTAEGSIAGPVEDGAFTVSGEKHTLGEVRSIRFGIKASVSLSDGRVLEGVLEGLDALSIVFGERSVAVKTRGAELLRAVPPSCPPGSFACTVVARSQGAEVGRQRILQWLAGREPAGIEALLAEKFVKPAASAKPVTRWRIVSTAKESVGRGRAYEFDAKDLKIPGCSKATLLAEAGGFHLQVVAPKDKELKAGEYAGAKRALIPDDAPGLSFSGNGRGPNQLRGTFVVWEYEEKDGVLVRCAIDFIQVAEGSASPVVGMLRYNSSFE